MRPQLAWIGDGWESDDATWNPIYLLQPGLPEVRTQETRLVRFDTKATHIVDFCQDRHKHSGKPSCFGIAGRLRRERGGRVHTKMVQRGREARLQRVVCGSAVPNPLVKALGQGGVL